MYTSSTRLAQNLNQTRVARPRCAGGHGRNADSLRPVITRKLSARARNGRTGTRFVPNRGSEQDLLSELEEAQEGGLAGYVVISSQPTTALLDTAQFPIHLTGLNLYQIHPVA